MDTSTDNKTKKKPRRHQLRKRQGRYGEDENDESVAAPLPQSSTRGSTRFQQGETTSNNNNTTSVGAYAVRGEETVLRRGQGVEDVSLFSSETPAVATTTTDPQQRRQTTILVQGELAEPAAQPIIVAHAQPTEDLEARLEEVENRNRELEELNRRYQCGQADEPVQEQDHADVVAPQGPSDVTPTDPSTDKKKKKKRRLIVLGAAVLVVISVVAIAVPVASNSGGGGNDANSNTTFVDSPSPTSPPIAPSPNTPTNTAFPTTAGSPTSRFPTISPTPTPTRFPTATTTPVAPTSTWVQLGQNFTGKGANDAFGRSVALSGDCTVMAVGAPQLVTDRLGYVSVFRYHDGSWVPWGPDILGEETREFFSESISLNFNGTIVAIGAELNDQGGTRAGLVEVYEYDESNARWNQLGSDIVGEAEGDHFGSSVSLSHEGDVVAIGAPADETSSGPYSGSVRVFRYNRGAESWDPQGQTLIGQSARDEIGHSVSVSGNGTIVAIGIPFYPSGLSKAGQVSVFQYLSASSRWVPLGSPINGQINDGLVGFSVSLDASGFVVAISASGSNGAFVFDFNNKTSEWTQRGDTLVYEGAEDADFGRSLSLSHDGNVVAVGTSDSLHVRIYQYDTATEEWNPVGDDLNGDASGDEFGYSVSLAGNGTVVGIGAWAGESNGLTLAGYAKVFNLS